MAMAGMMDRFGVMACRGIVLLNVELRRSWFTQ
jgi:hypothetical protein